MAVEVGPDTKKKSRAERKSRQRRLIPEHGGGKAVTYFRRL
jgi:hypothetical protein